MTTNSQPNTNRVGISTAPSEIPGAETPAVTPGQRHSDAIRRAVDDQVILVSNLRRGVALRRGDGEALREGWERIYAAISRSSATETSRG